MENIFTSGCKEFGHPEFRIEFDANGTLNSDASFFGDQLTQMVREGRRFENDQSVQVGWSFTKVILEADGFLTFREPDFKSMPIVWQRGLTNTLRHMRLHKDVLESLLSKESLAIPSLRESCIICTNLNGTGRMMMDRQEPQAGISGWFLGCVDKEHDRNNVQFLRKVSLYEAVVNHAPMALGYLGLPAGIFVLLGSGAPSFDHEGHTLEILKGSYLDAVFGSRTEYQS